MYGYKMGPIFLIGYMGSGKTTLGQAVAQVADVRFVDMDDYIEARNGMSIKELFAVKGEAGFRELERQALYEVADAGNVLVACGGGTPCFFDNMKFMNSHGVTVWLKASVERLVARLTLERGKRPLVADKDDSELHAFVIDALERRSPYYSKAKVVFDADYLDNQMEIDASVTDFVKMFSLPLK